MFIIPKKDILYYVTIDNYPTQTLISKSRRTKYAINKKGEKYISNKGFAGKPRYRTISGQDLWSMSLNKNIKGKMAQELKHFYYERFRGLEPIDNYPVGVRLRYEGVIERKPDLDNLNMFHLKCIQDALCGNVHFLRVDSDCKRGYKLEPDYVNYPPLVVDDDISHINELHYEFGIREQEKMIITVYKNKFT